MLRVWLDAPNLMVSYERRGITVVTLSVRQEAAHVAAKKFDTLVAEHGAEADPEILETLNEIRDMVREALNGGPGQILSLDGEVLFSDLFGEVS